MAQPTVAARYILKWEGGFVDNPDDPGGPTNHGILLRELQEKGIDVNHDGVVDIEDIKALSPDEAMNLFVQDYWDADMGGIEDQAVATKIMDGRVNLGNDTAAKIAQAAAGVEADGKIGPATVAAINALGGAYMAKLIEGYVARYWEVVGNQARAQASGKAKKKLGWDADTCAKIQAACEARDFDAILAVMAALKAAGKARGLMTFLRGWLNRANALPEAA